MPKKVTKKPAPKKAVKKVVVKIPKKFYKKLDVVESVEQAIAEVEASPVVEVAVQLPTVDNVRVVKILEDGRETDDHFHCAMADGTTRHVLKSLF